MNTPLNDSTQQKARDLARQITVAHDLDPEIQEELYGHIEDKLLAYKSGEERVSDEDALILVREKVDARHKGAWTVLSEAEHTSTQKGSEVSLMPLICHSHDFALPCAISCSTSASNPKCVLPRTGLSKLLCAANRWFPLQREADIVYIIENEQSRAAA